MDDSSESVKSNRNINLDIAKVLFAIAILMHHRTLLGLPYSQGYLAVDFFFFTSGFLMMKSSEKQKPTGEFLLGRVSIWLPILVSAELISIPVYTYTTGGGSLSDLVPNGILGINEILLLQMAHIPGYWSIGVGWFFSSLFLSMAILYPLVKRYPEASSGPLLAVGLLLLGLLYATRGTVSGPGESVGLMYSGMIRGFADVCLGTFCYSCYKRIKDINFKKAGRILLAVVGIAIAAILVWMMFIDPNSAVTGSKNRYQFTALLLEWLLLLIIVSEKSILHIQKPHPLLAKYLGPISLLIVVGHCWVYYLVSYLGLADDPFTEFLICIPLFIVSIVVCYILSKLLSGAYRSILKAITDRGQGPETER